MRKAIVTALTTALVLSVATGIASARRGLRFSTRNVVANFSNLQFEGGLANPIKCNMTLAATFHETTIPKIEGTLIGLASMGFSTGACAAGNMGLLKTGVRVTGKQGPYHTQYASFSGTLPNITELTLRTIGVEFWILTPEGIECLTRGGLNLQYITRGNPATRLEWSATRLPLTGGILCSLASGTITSPTPAELFAELALRTRASVTITLI